MVATHRLVTGLAILVVSIQFAGGLPALGVIGSPPPPSPGHAVPPEPTREVPREGASSSAAIGFRSAEQRRCWHLQGERYDIGFDAEENRAGAPSLRLALRPGAIYHDGAFAVASTHLAVEEARGKRVRLAGWIKTSGIDRGWAGLWVRVDGVHGVLAFDNMGDRGVHGTTGWSRVEVAIEVPAEAAAIVLGVLLSGDGAAWVSDLDVSLGPVTQVVDGAVIDPAGRPVAGALVAAVADDQEKAAAVVRTGRDGSFRVAVPAGKLTLTATAGGFVATLQALSETRGEGSRRVVCRLGDKGPQLRGELRAAGGLPPAGTRVALARFQEDGGGFYYGELDGNGRFHLGLPPGHYHVALDSDAYGALSPGVVQLGDDDLNPRVTFAASRLVAVSEDVVRWLELHVAPLRTTMPGPDHEDLRPLAAMVGKAQVVALGEATHGTREFFQLKHRVLEYLVSEMGFTVFAIEANWPESLAIDDYVLHGKGDAAQALGGLFYVWNTEEVLDMIEWMRAFNADAAHRHKVRFFGFDMQFAGLARRAVAAYLDKVDARYAKEVTARLDGFPDDPRRAARAASTAALATARALVERLDAHRSDYVARSSREEWELVRQHAAILEQSAALADPQQPDDRDRAMADDVDWILAHQPPATRMVLWGHNTHVNYGKERGGYTPMGEYLRRKLGSGYMSIGFLFDRGAYQAMRVGGQGLLGLHEFSVGPSPIDSLAAAFHRTGLALGVLDLRSCPRTGPIGAWLLSPHAVRESGAFFLGEPQMWTIPAAITERFDGLLYVDRTTRARPILPGAR